MTNTNPARSVGSAVVSMAEQSAEKEQPEYRIEFSVQRRLPDDEDFTEIGFGSSGGWHDLDACTHWIDSAVTHGEWETTGDMPNPDDVMTAIEEARHG